MKTDPAAFERSPAARINRIIAASNIAHYQLAFKLILGGGKFSPSSFFVIALKLPNAFPSNFLNLCRIYFYTFSENFALFSKQW